MVEESFSCILLKPGIVPKYIFVINIIVPFYFDKSVSPNHVLINDYKPSEGILSALFFLRFKINTLSQLAFGIKEFWDFRLFSSFFFQTTIIESFTLFFYEVIF